MSPVPGMESPALELALFLAFACGLFVGAIFARCNERKSLRDADFGGDRHV